MILQINANMPECCRSCFAYSSSSEQCRITGTSVAYTNSTSGRCENCPICKPEENMTTAQRKEAAQNIIDYFRWLDKENIEYYYPDDCVKYSDKGTNVIDNCSRADAQAIRRMVNKRVESSHLCDVECELMYYNEAKREAGFDLN